ncbi:hypothetical protein ACOSQ3_009668 [Xanthoceras sorbifolium]
MVIDVDDYDVFMKYIGGLAEYIRKELKLFIVETIEDAIVKAIAIEAKNKRADKRDDKQLSEEIPEVNQADTKLALMANPTESMNVDHREELFHMNIQVKQSVVEAIIDSGSQKILISETLVQKMGLDTTPRPKPYTLGWIQKDVDMRIMKHCTFQFAITDRYIDEVTCKDGNEFHINACKYKATKSLLTAAQAKRLVNASG